MNHIRNKKGIPRESEIHPVGISCREAENLMLSDDALNHAGTDWPAFQEKLQIWILGNGEHQYFAEVQAFVEGGFNRKDHDLKEIRNILIGLVSNKPWEVLVGQAIAGLSINGGADGPGSLRDFLGEKVCETLFNFD